MPEVKLKPAEKSELEVKPKPVAKAKPAAKPAAAKPAAAKPVAAKPVAAKPVAAKPVAAKPTAAKPTAAKPAAAKPAAAKSKPVAKSAVGEVLAAKPKTRSKKSTAVSVTPEERYQMVAKAAYFRAEKRGFAAGDTAQDWLDAEEEIERMLQTPPSKAAGLPITAKQALAFQKKLEKQIQDWDAKVADLKAKAQAAKADIRADYEKQLETLVAKRELIQTRLQELRLHAGHAWGDIKSGAEKAWEEMQKSLDQISARFK